MRIAFQETMRGTLSEPGGAEHLVDFEVTARSEGKGFFTLEGTAHAEPWVPECPATGTLTLSLLPRFIRYQVQLTARDGQRYTILGEKRPKLLAPISSMTLMPTKLVDAKGQVLAEGQMRFDLADLPRFLSSWVSQPVLGAFASKG